MFYNIRLPDIYSEAHQMGLLGRMDFLYSLNLCFTDDVVK